VPYSTLGHAIQITEDDARGPMSHVPCHWATMRERWGRDEFQRVSSNARKNREHTTTTHTGGSISFSVHRVAYGNVFY
jgi:hypothetical protein